MNYKSYKKKIVKRNKTLIRELDKRRESKVISLKGLKLTICPGVFDPSLGEGSQIIIENNKLLSGNKVLELGTGTGVLAMLAAQNSKFVVATDISKKAIDCARLNFKENSLDQKIELRKGYLFDVIDKNEKFDQIIFNPPFLEGNPNSTLENSYYDSDYKILETFFSIAHKYLTTNGNIVICFGGVGDIGYFEYLIEINNYTKIYTDSVINNDLLFFVHQLKRGK